MTQALAIGNAIRLFITPPIGAVRWRVLRKTSNTFSGEADATAVLVADGDPNVILDTAGLVNGTLYYYQDYYYDGTAWTAGTGVSVTPAASYGTGAQDVLSVVRDRLDLGLQVEIARGSLSPASGRIAVLTAPPVFEDTRWPVVSVHLESDAAQDRALGEEIYPDVSLDGGLVESFEGWLARVQLLIVGWCLNADERIALRQTIKRVLLGNLQVFDAAGFVQIDLAQNDTEDFTSYNAPVYQVLSHFSCLAPEYVSDETPSITDITVSVTA